MECVRAFVRSCVQRIEKTKLSRSLCLETDRGGGGGPWQMLALALALALTLLLATIIQYSLAFPHHT